MKKSPPPALTSQLGKNLWSTRSFRVVAKVVLFHHAKTCHTEALVHYPWVCGRQGIS